MNIKKKSIIIPAFALLIGASLAGSITGTVAWYQYSTRVNTAYVGVSGGTSGNLQIKLGNNEWSTRLTKDTIETYVGNSEYGANIMPITSGAMDKDDALPTDFYSNPLYGQDSYNKWIKAEKANYIVLPLQLRYVERDGVKEVGVDAKNVAKEVFLSDLTIKGHSTNAANEKEDLSDAIRFHIDAFKEEDRNAPANHINRLISKKGGTTVTEGQLDLDGDGDLDCKYNSGDIYGFDDGDTTSPIIYGNGSQVAFSNEVETRAGSYYTSDGQDGADANVYGMVVDSVDDTLDIENSTKEYDTGKSKSIGSTIESETEFLNVVVTIWVEGWQTFENANHEHKSIWDSADFIKSSFDVGFQFAVDPVE